MCLHKTVWSLYAALKMTSELHSCQLVLTQSVPPLLISLNVANINFLLLTKLQPNIFSSYSLWTSSFLCLRCSSPDHCFLDNFYYSDLSLNGTSSATPFLTTWSKRASSHSHVASFYFILTTPHKCINPSGNENNYKHAYT